VTAANNFINRRDSAEDEIGKKIRKLIGSVIAREGGFDRQEFADHLHIRCDIEERKTTDMHFLRVRISRSPVNPVCEKGGMVASNRDACRTPLHTLSIV
jgi:hypothetical protein